jgi:hypothetical protein
LLAEDFLAELFLVDELFFAPLLLAPLDGDPTPKWPKYRSTNDDDAFLADRPPDFFAADEERFAFTPKTAFRAS